jgi:hypothetical protein
MAATRQHLSPNGEPGLKIGFIKRRTTAQETGLEIKK